MGLLALADRMGEGLGEEALYIAPRAPLGSTLNFQLSVLAWTRSVLASCRLNPDR
jgi:hypothetical protein